MTAFLAAETHAEHERLATWLVVTAVGCQGDKRAIERLQRELTADAKP